jgi:hypothetical protein
MTSFVVDMRLTTEGSQLNVAAESATCNHLGAPCHGRSAASVRDVPAAADQIGAVPGALAVRPDLTAPESMSRFAPDDIDNYLFPLVSARVSRTWCQFASWADTLPDQSGSRP